MTRSILFDLDGVLVETRDLHFRALNAALEAHGCRPIGAIEHDEEYNGLPTRVKLDRLVSFGRVRAEDVSSIAALKQKETRRLLEAEVKFSPEMFCLLWGLRMSNYLLGVVTNAVPETAKLVIDRLLLNPRVVIPCPVQHVVANDAGAPKPEPDLYCVAAHKLNVRCDECLAVEDGEFGVRAATAAGCKVLRVSGPQEVTPKRIWEALC